MIAPRACSGSDHSGTTLPRNPAFRAESFINGSLRETLDALPGIGPVKAQAIIDGRPYKKPEDIMKVKGIKQGEFNKIKDLISVE